MEIRSRLIKPAYFLRGHTGQPGAARFFRHKRRAHTDVALAAMGMDLET